MAFTHAPGAFQHLWVSLFTMVVASILMFRQTNSLYKLGLGLVIQYVRQIRASIRVVYITRMLCIVEQAWIWD